MLYGVLRILFSILMFIVVIILTGALKYNKKKFIIILTSIFSIVLCTVSYLFPIENIFINFKTPEKVFKYSNVGEIEDVICGNDSCMIVSSTKEYSYAYTFVLKSSKGYKIGSSFSYEEIANRIKGSKNLTLFKVKDTKDYYVFGYFTADGKELNISDNIGSEFKSIIVGEKSSSRNTYITYAFIDDIKEEYYITIDDEELILDIY